MTIIKRLKHTSISANTFNSLDIYTALLSIAVKNNII